VNGGAELENMAMNEIRIETFSRDSQVQFRYYDNFSGKNNHVFIKDL